MSDKRLMLKIKLKSLAEEARIIRKDERKVNGWKRDSLHRHRVVNVRREARDSYIAYGFLRGHKYRTIEPSTRANRPGPNWRNVQAICSRFGDYTNPIDIEELKKWIRGVDF